MNELSGLLIVQSDPLPGREDEYHDWYSNQHLQHVVKVPGFVSGQRFSISPVQRLADNPPPSHGFLSVYEVVGDPATAFALMNQALAEGRMPVSDAMDPGRRSHFWQPITPRVERAS